MDTEKLVSLNKSIEEIFISFSNRNMFYSKAYKIDFKNNALWTTNDTKNTNAPLTFVKNIDSKHIDNFIDSSKKYGFTSWKVYYEDDSICDGTDWRIIIRFSDTTSQFSTGTCGGHKNPENWNEMVAAFKDLMGKDMWG